LEKVNAFAGKSLEKTSIIPMSERFWVMRQNSWEAKEKYGIIANPMGPYWSVWLGGGGAGNFWQPGKPATMGF
jgi:hypothetical protein